MKRPRHAWESIPQKPIDLISALSGPVLTWRERCAKCGAQKGTRRETAKASGRGVFSIRWRDVYCTADGKAVTKLPECMLAGVSNA